MSAAAANVAFTVFVCVFALGFVAWLGSDWAAHRRKVRRMQAYSVWVRRMAKSPDPRDRESARWHAFRVMRQGLEGDYRGPWDDG